MLSETQVRLLLRLAEFGAEMETSWDVPRSLSLPGLAEHLGLVRSAIHSPLKELESSGLISTRSAHVIGGGSRRRTVVHLTSIGRERAESLSKEEHKSEDFGRVVGPIPDSIHLHGREEVAISIAESLSSGSRIHLSGLPGIGKTSLARSIAGKLLEKGWRVRWSTCHADADAQSIGRMWMDGESPSDPTAIALAASGKKTLIVLDEVQELSPRHLESISKILSSCTEIGATVLIAVRAPSPFTEISGFEEIRIEGLDIQDAIELLPENTELELAKQVADAFGGHPLALRLWSPEDEAPGEGQEVQDYVEQTVIRRLSGEGTSTLDELSLAPIPIEISELSDDSGTAELDDAAVLRWAESLVEPHHLIRNVRRASLNENEIRSIHSRVAEFWSEREGSRARRIEAHHRIKSGEEPDIKWLLQSISMVAKEDNAAAAVLMEDAVVVSDDESIRLAAVDLALERGDTSIAENHIKEVSPSPQSIIRQARIARLKGDSNLASELELQALEDLPPADLVRHQISTLVRNHDDRLPGTLTIISTAEIDGIDISRLPDSDKSAASLALNLLRHAVAIEKGNVELAVNTRSALATVLSEGHPRLALIDLRTRLATESLGAIEAAQVFITDEDNGPAKVRAIHATLEATYPDYPDWLVSEHANLSAESLRSDVASHRRLIAQYWYWRGMLEPSMRLSHWREAISRFKTAECSNAAAELLIRLTQSL
ncbi:MAG: AAA family ATPase [Candidatus Thalassarchaeaceae archaeon]|nr:AAA family ATPase [Candidatus Thalassarchaeaceae archaeon]